MLTPVLVLAICSVVILTGAMAELVEALRLRRGDIVDDPATVRARVLSELDLRPALAWLGLAALAVLAPVLLASRPASVSEVALVVVVLGLAAERAGYLIRRFARSDGRGGWTAAVAGFTMLGGVVMALTV